MALESADIPGGLGKPTLVAPPGTCDCHMHVIYPERRFPFIPGKENVFPEHSCAAYMAAADSLGIERCVVVLPPFYDFDNASTCLAVQEIGLPARAVVNVGPDVTDAELEALDKAGARGANFFMLPGRCLDWGALKPVAEKVHALGWHVQIQLDGRLLGDYADLLGGLPTKIVIDHIGKFLGPADLNHSGFKALLRLLDGGQTYVKLSAPYESSLDEPPYMKDAGRRAAALIKAAPERMLWASNWPHLGHPVLADKPENAMMLDVLLAWAEDASVRNAILVDTPARLYGFGGL
jgi:D-galactarolactone isomerase